MLLPDPAAADAASYIRTLFDATIVNPGAALDCQHFAPLARFGAGPRWRDYDSTERQEFDSAFCDLAGDTLARLKERYPDLALRVLESHDESRNMVWIRSLATARGSDWPVDWLVGGHNQTPYLADLKVMGVSLAIMLRSMAGPVTDSNPAAVIQPWRQALERALPE